MAKSTKPNSQTEKPKVHEKLSGMNIHVNEFGEIIKDYNVDDINAFLNEKVKDKKFTQPDDSPATDD